MHQGQIYAKLLQFVEILWVVMFVTVLVAMYQIARLLVEVTSCLFVQIYELHYFNLFLISFTVGFPRTKHPLGAPFYSKLKINTLRSFLS